MEIDSGVFDNTKMVIVQFMTSLNVEIRIPRIFIQTICLILDGLFRLSLNGTGTGEK